MVSQSPRNTPTRRTPNRGGKQVKQVWVTCGTCNVRVPSSHHDCEVAGAVIHEDHISLYSLYKDTTYCHFHPDTLKEMGLKIGSVVRVGSEIYECWPDTTIPLDNIGIDIPERKLMTVNVVESVRNAATIFIKSSSAIDTSTLPFLLQNRILYPGQQVKIPFFNKDIEIVVLSVAIFPQESTSGVGELAETMSKVSISDLYYKILPSTIFSCKKDPKKLPKLVGCDDVVAKVCRIVKVSLEKEELFGSMGPPPTLLVSGPSGCGKTLLVRKVLQDLNLEFCEISNFSEPLSCKEDSRVVFVDGVDIIRDDDFDSIKRLELFVKNLSKNKIIISTASILPSPLKKHFPLIVNMPPVNNHIRHLIFKNIFEELKENGNEVSLSESDIKILADRTNGYVGGDIYNVCRLALLESGHEALSSMRIMEAITKVAPASMNDMKIEVPEVTWEDIGGLKDIQKILQEVISWPIIYHDQYQAMGIKPPKGALLYGPPGCCKTMMAKALAATSGLNFISVKGPELLSMYVGESERAVRNLFTRARVAAPAIIFFDEIDALATHRGADRGGSGVNDRVIAQLLTELDGVEDLTGVTVIAATNRPDRLDKALLRPGRFEKLIYIPPPDVQCIEEILRIKFARIPHDTNIDFKKIATQMEGFSGAEVVSVCNTVAISSIMNGNVSTADITFATENLTPQIDSDTLKFYESFNASNAKMT